MAFVVFFMGFPLSAAFDTPQLNVVLFRGPVRTRQRAAMPQSQVTFRLSNYQRLYILNVITASCDVLAIATRCSYLRVCVLRVMSGPCIAKTGARTP
jgi:hypothetical protein